MRVGFVRSAAKAVAGMAAAVGIVAAAPANAAIIEFTNWVSNDAVLVLPTFTVEEQSGGFRVTVGVDGASPNPGLLSGIFFDLSDLISETDIAFPIAIDNFGNNTVDVGGGVNLNGLTSDLFDVGFGFAQTSIYPTALMFSVSDLGGALTLDDWTRVGLRFQTVGANGEGSDKLLSASVGEVPLPAALWLMTAGLAGLGFASGRRRQAI